MEASDTSKRPAFSWLAEGLAALSGGVALVGLVAINLDLPALAGMGKGYIPIAPLAAGCFLLLDAAVLLVRLDRGKIRAARGLGYLALALCLVTTIGYTLNGSLAATVDVRQISPLTLATLGLSGLAFALAGTLPVPGPRRRQLAVLAALGALALCAVVLLSYLGGAPLLYLSRSTPMALPSAICGLLLGLALLTLGGKDVWPATLFSATVEEPRLQAGPLTAFLVLALAILVGGSLHLRGQLASARKAAQEELDQIAQLKAAQITHWFQERLDDAQEVQRSSLLQTQLRLFLAGTGPSEPEVREWLEGHHKPSQFQRLVLFDGEGRVRLAVPRVEPSQLAGLAPRARAALRSPEATVRDLHRQGTAIHLDFWAPIGAAPQGVLLMQVDAEDYLFPQLQAWPIASPSAETLLVRREGGEIVYLNELRHRQGTALLLRRSTTEPSSLPAAFLASKSAFATGLDYRGVPSLAVRKAVAGTPWVITAKVDAQEVYGPLRRQTWTTLAVLMALVVLLALALGQMLHQRRTAGIAAQLAQERKLKIMAGRFEHLLRLANDAILLFDGDGFILEGNQRAVEFYGRTPEELRGLHLAQLTAEGDGSASRARFATLKRTGALRFESVHARKDGSTFPVQVSTRMVGLEGETIALSIIQDITERQARTRDMERLSHLYAALSQVNQSIVWSRDREELFARICQVLVTFGRYRMAWIAGLEPDGRTVSVQKSHGDADGFLADLEATGDARAGGLGPAATAIFTDRPCIRNEFQDTLGARSGFRAAAAFPIHLQGQVCGALVVYNDEPDCFGDKETLLLLEAAVDVSFALDHLAGEERRLATEHALRESLAFNRAMIETIPFGLSIVDEEGRILFMNPALEAILGSGALGGLCWTHNKDDQSQCPACPLKEPIEVGRTTLDEIPGLLGGKWFQVTHTGMLYNGRKAVLELFHDITARKRAEAEHRELTAQLHQSQKMESLGSLAGGIAHDINNVLAAILSLASAHREGLEPTTTLAHSLDTITRACLRGRDVVKSLLYFARKGLGTLGPVDLNAVVRDLAQLLERTTLQRLRLEVDLTEPLPPILGDTGSLSHAIMNLCVNAKDAMPEGGTLVLATRLLEDGRIELAVADTGHGMEPGILERAMEPFFTTKPVGQGTGLGLAMVFGTVKAMGGTMDLSSAPGEGTEARLRFPPFRGPGPDGAAPPPKVPAAPRTLSILLVDDDELIRGSVAPMLTLLGHRVQAVAAGREALALFEAGLEVDLVILDMNMPDLNGAETLKRLLLLRPGQAVLMASGYNDHDLTALLAGRPRVLSLQKPFQLAELQERLRELS